MPKMKTKSSAKKRFKVTGSGKIKRKHAFKNHILTKKSKKRKLRLTHFGLVHESDENNIKIIKSVALDKNGAQLNFANRIRSVNLIGEQAIFLLKKNND